MQDPKHRYHNWYRVQLKSGIRWEVRDREQNVWACDNLDCFTDFLANEIYMKFPWKVRINEYTKILIWYSISNGWLVFELLLQIQIYTNSSQQHIKHEAS